MIVPFILAAGVSLADYFSGDIQLFCGRYLHWVTSAAGGVVVSYLFIQLLPEFVEGVGQGNRLIFLTVLAGFAAVHVAEKYIYQHSPIKKLKKELAVEDSMVLFLYNFVVGILLFEFALDTNTEAVLLFIPVFLHSAMSGLPLDVSNSNIIRGIPAVAPVLGAAYAFMVGALPPTLKFSLIGIVTGALIFSVTRHHLPFGRKGSPEWFIAGVIVYSTIIVASWITGGNI